MFTLCPKLTVDTFHRLLERYNLAGKHDISLKDFESAFLSPPLGQSWPPIVYKGLDPRRTYSVANAFQLLRQSVACDPDFDLHSLLPPSCFEQGGRVLCPQLREAMRLMRINMSDENYRRLWKQTALRPDNLFVIAIFPVQIKSQLSNSPVYQITFCDQAMCEWQLSSSLGVLSTYPKPEIPTYKAPPLSSKRIKFDGLGRPCDETEPLYLTPNHSWTPQGPGGLNKPVFGCGDRYVQRLAHLREHQPKFDDLLDCLTYKIDLPYHGLIVAFSRRDPSSHMSLTEPECFNALAELGIRSCNVETMRRFVGYLLSPSERSSDASHRVGSDRPSPDVPDDGNRVRPGRIPYKRMLDYYGNRQRCGRVWRIIQRLIESPDAGKEQLSADPTPEQLEEKFIYTLHQDYIEMAKKLKVASAGTNNVKVNCLKCIVTSTVGYPPSDEQWKEFEAHLVKTSPETYDVAAFLGLFNKISANPSRMLATVPDNEKIVCPPNDEKFRGLINNKAALMRKIYELIHTKLHQLNRLYKVLKVEERNKITRENFCDMITNVGYRFNEAEIDFLWSLVEAVDPGKRLHGYCQIMKFFSEQSLPIAAELDRLDRHSALPKENLDKFKAWYQAMTKSKQAFERDQLIKQAQVLATLPKRQSTCGKPDVTPSDDRIKELNAKLLPAVSSRWQALRHAFHTNDCHGTMQVNWQTFEKIAKDFNFNLDKGELYELCSGYNAKCSGYFNYEKFLNHFAPLIPQQSKPSTQFDTLSYQFTDLKTGKKISSVDLITSLRYACKKKWRTLREAFNKLDRHKTGEISPTTLYDFFQTQLGISLSPDDQYHLTCIYDTSMDGRINIHEFLSLTSKALGKPIQL